MDINKIKKVLLSIFWVLKHYLGFRKSLFNKYGVKKLSIFNFTQWHGGACYFMGELNSKPVFIKTDAIQTGILTNEYTACEILNESNSNHFPKALLLGTINNIDFIIIEKFSGISLTKHLTQQQNSIKQDEQLILEQLIDIINILHKNEIVHRDIRPDNIQICESNNNLQVVLFDFAYCIDSKKRLINKRFVEVDFLPCYPALMKSLGEDYKQSYYLWDDAYSVFQISKRDLDLTRNRKLIEIERLIGKQTYFINEGSL